MKGKAVGHQQPIFRAAWDGFWPQRRTFLEHHGISWAFSGGTEVKNLPASAGDTRGVGLIPGLVRSPGGGNGNPLQYSCLKNSTDRGAWWATVQGGGVTKNPTQLNTTHPHGISYSHLLYCLDLLSSYNKFIIPGNRISKTLIGPIS